jgi:hypothetical protein
MVDGILQALVTESIVQTIVELARAAAAAAGSYGADPAVEMHLVAAGMWAAVGGVAGAAGAALGSFGHPAGGAPAKPGDTTNSANASHASQQNQQPGGNTYYILPGALTTKAEMAAILYDTMNHGARNNVGQLDPRAVRRT